MSIGNKKEFTNLINKIRLVKSSFGKPRLELDMAPKDFEKLKEKVGKENPNSFENEGS